MKQGRVVFGKTGDDTLLCYIGVNGASIEVAALLGGPARAKGFGS